MGATLGRIYDIVTERKGNEGRMTFTQITGVPRNKALKGKETPEVINHFVAAANNYLGEDISSLL